MYETTPAPAPSTDRAAEAPFTDRVLMWVTALSVALIPVAVLFGGLAQMAAEVHPRTAAVVMAGWWASWTATPLLALAFRLSLRHPALAPAGRWAGWIAPVPPTLTILLVLGL
ncbi:hypothetical protein [Streptomyces sp. WM6372]|uniref:hypothetical protein n=1 Tax=Streptomyces sp. WM6372 TaxID=1415555 RepID=UPI000AB141E6|nr:hypothetical protein [Streptomyces sp. WM6372]